MNCKFCNAELEENNLVCPECGKAQEEQETLLEQEPLSEETVTEQPQQSQPEEPEQLQETEESKQPTAAPKQKPWVIIAAGIACLALLLGMIYLILVGAGVDVKELFKKKETAMDLYPSYTEDYGVYTEEDAATAAANKDVVVATINGNKLTNGLLQIYYRLQVDSFASYYAAYLEYLGFDENVPLSQQECYFDTTLTWEEYFLNAAIDSWQRYQTLSVLAYDGDFQLDELLQKDLSDLLEIMESGAKDEGLESADDLIQQQYGANCTAQDYISYMSIYYAGLQYYTEKYDEYVPTMEQIEAYYEANEEMFTEDGITKDSGLRSDIRHILITPQGGTVDTATGQTTYSEEEWETCRKKAQDLLDQWLATGDDATEESFAELANAHSADGGSNTSGGLYQGITPGSNYVEDFLNWSVDSSRKPGDTGLVKSVYGYHIMYFVSGEEIWIYNARSGYLTEKLDEMIQQAMEKWPMEIHRDKISLAPIVTE